jgi:hypothetical protein
MGGGAVIAAAASARRRRFRQVLDAFRLAGATAPERAQRSEQLLQHRPGEFDELARAGVLVGSERDDTWYLDETRYIAWREAGRARRARMALILVFVGLALLAAGLLGIFQSAPATSPSSAANDTLGSSRASANATADSLLELDRRWGQSYVKGDSAFVAGFLGSDWMGWFDDEPQVKNTALAEVGTGAPRLAADSIDHATVRLFSGSVAVVQARELNQVAGANGSHWEARHITDILINRDGRWVVVASHDSRIPYP